MLQELFEILSDKEQTVVTKRFALDNKPRQTLEKIGRSFLVTRERVRQIEASALQKLKRNIFNTKLNLINKTAEEILRSYDGVVAAEKLVSKIISLIHKDSPIDTQIINLALTVNPNVEKVDSLGTLRSFYCFSTIEKVGLKKISEAAEKVLQKMNDITSEKILIGGLGKRFKDLNISPARVASIFSIDNRLKKVGENWGLSAWRHINPKSIRDRALIVLRREAKPLHFVKISNLISSAEFSRRAVTQQAVHNDLIRYPEFVLVGRGMYGLKEWGLKSGTVSDVIAQILRENGSMSRAQIIKEVLKQREVKTGTISLNLQKNIAFVRVGRAVYSFDEKAWETQPRSPRGRATKQVI